MNAAEKRRVWASGGPADEIQEMQLDGFSAYDDRHRLRGDWITSRKTGGDA